MMMAAPMINEKRINQPIVDEDPCTSIKQANTIDNVNIVLIGLPSSSHVAPVNPLVHLQEPFWQTPPLEH